MSDPGAVRSNGRAREGRSSLTRRVRFSATHRYHRPDWDDETNVATFGACAAPTPHGHDYACDVTIGGPIHSATGMVLDLAVLDRILDEQVVRPFHGRSINADPAFAPGELIPTCEEVARLIAHRVNDALHTADVRDARVVRVRVAEDETLSAEWTDQA